jgi:hypothetical protein
MEVVYYTWFSGGCQIGVVFRVTVDHASLVIRHLH